jgi:hypothetical protein
MTLICKQCKKEFFNFTPHRKTSAKKYCNECLYKRTRRYEEKRKKSRNNILKK